MIPSITEAQVLDALGNLLATLLPQLMPSNIIIGQINRVASPEGDYIVMWPLSRTRLGTNLETPIDCKFTASIVGNQMTVTAVALGEIEPGNQVFGVGLINNTVIKSQSSGETGGAGVYVVSGLQNVGAETMSTGVLSIATPTEMIIQCDVHGPNSGDNAQVMSNIIRSSFAADQLEGTGVSPLFSDDPRQTPFETAAKQYEERWTIDVHLQIMPSVTTGQQFFDAVTLTLSDVDVNFPDDPVSELSTDLTIPSNEVIVPAILTGV